ENLLKAVLVREPRRALHTIVRRYPAEHDRPNPASPQLQLELGPVERPPLLLRYREVAFLRPDLRHEVRGVGWRGRRRAPTRVIREHVEAVRGRRGHMYQEDRHTVLPKCLR